MIQAGFAAFANIVGKTAEVRSTQAIFAGCGGGGWPNARAGGGRSGDASQPRLVWETVVTYLYLEQPETLIEHLEIRDSYPRLNAQDEKKLREALLLLADLSTEASKKRIAELNEEHASRRETVWARRGEAPLAQALAFIAKVAAAKPLPSHDGNALAEAYVAAGANTDWAGNVRPGGSAARTRP